MSRLDYLERTSVASQLLAALRHQLPTALRHQLPIAVVQRLLRQRATVVAVQPAVAVALRSLVGQQWQPMLAVVVAPKR